MDGASEPTTLVTTEAHEAYERVWVPVPRIEDEGFEPTIVRGRE
jgi:hypothetical protein